MIELKAKPEFATRRIEFLYNAMKNAKETDVFFVVRNRMYVCLFIFKNNK